MKRLVSKWMKLSSNCFTLIGKLELMKWGYGNY